MKLITHNILTSRCLKGVTNGYPLKILAEEVDKDNVVDFNKEFIQRLIPKMEWNVLASAAKDFGVELPAEAPQPADADDETLKKIHHAALEIEIINGHLECPETGRKFPIKKGIPNMLCNEDEVDSK
ncbi:tRNA methyltransferase subunit 11-2 [Brevipalpus obovatus]|uniref:tRNA methyltransferase subunit 11-2 n=1 Tax=Brevipalpus obovatus TaxID=246614 RepID=UPI003D9E0192